MASKLVYLDLSWQDVSSVDFLLNGNTQHNIETLILDNWIDLNMSDVNSILENTNRLIFLEMSSFDHDRESFTDLCNQYDVILDTKKLSKNISSLNPISSFVTPATNTKTQASKDGNQTEEVQSGQSPSLHNLSNLSKSIADAEILWSLKCVESHFSAHSNIGMNELFRKMFCDSQIAEGYSLSESKYRYVTTFGLGPHFAKKLLWDVQKSPAHTFLFDESLNAELQSKQMDVHVRYWCNETDRVQSRWLENLTVANKSITLLPYIKEYCNQAALNKTEPKEHAGYQSVKKAINEDKLLKAKHLFWISLAQDFQPFLKMYQTEKPMVPFLASDLQNLLRSVMNRFIKENVLSSANSFTQVAKVDVSLDKNKKTCKELDIAFLSSTAGKLLEKCPLKFPIVRFLRSLDPQEVHDNPKVLEGFQSYSVCEDRVDSFLASHLKSSKYQKLWNLVKCLLVLSHGQAGVERGFSVNKEAMQYHFKERSVVALRIIYDHIQSAGGILNVEIDQPLRNAVKSASSQYRNELKRQKEEEKSREQEEANKEVNDQICTFQAKRKRLLEHCSLLNESAEKLCERAERENEMLHLRKANSYKRTVKEMQKEADEIFANVEVLKKRLKKK
ncbi:unnamed protein product [Porites lobata]|uniref:Uncharacterized protein n=1 Tax=Porites lobata TaxID=104759 RepID=A0ABN8S0R7_9CNID|nr:unnamed protein product [Porites lobata]